jgi:hypothetical protein
MSRCRLCSDQVLPREAFQVNLSASRTDTLHPPFTAFLCVHCRARLIEYLTPSTVRLARAVH